MTTPRRARAVIPIAPWRSDRRRRGGRRSRCTRSTTKIYPRAVARLVRALALGAGVADAARVLRAAVAASGTAARRCCSTWRARRFYIFGLVLYPQDFIYLTGAAGALGARAVPVHRGGRAAVVRLCLPADGLHRDLPVGRAPHRRRPQRAHAARRRAVELRQAVAQGRQARRCGSRSALWTGFTFVGYFTPIRDAVGRRSRVRASGRGRSFWVAVLRLRDLRQRRLHARAGLQVHVPVRALPERDVRPRHADRQLRRASAASRAARARARPTRGGSASATASTARCACRSARPASTSATACSTSASAAPPASTPATA